MDLKKYIESRNFQVKEFAEMIGVSPAAITNYIARKRVPTLEIGRRIEVVTKGRVSIDDLIMYSKKGGENERCEDQVSEKSASSGNG